MLPDPPGRVRSNSYDESFLHRSAEASFHVLTPRAAEAPPRLQYTPRPNFEDDGPCDPPPTAVFLPQSDGTSPRSHTGDTALDLPRGQEFQDDIGTEKPSALPIHPKDSRLSQTASSAVVAKRENDDELPFDEGNPIILPIDRIYLTGPRVAAPKRIGSSDLTKEADESSIDGAPVQDEAVRQKGVNNKDEDDDDSLFEFAEKQESPTAPNVGDSFSDRKACGIVENNEADELDNSTQGNHQTISSLYSKSAESEVEDLIKDILLVGRSNDSRPGKRKVKQDRKGATKEDSGNGNQDGTDTTLAKVSNEREGDGEDPLTSVWNYLFDGGKSRDEFDEAQDSLATTLVTCPSTAGELFDYASELFLGGDSKASDGNAADENESTRVSRGNADAANASNKGVIGSTSVAPAPSLEEDLRLVELAIEAARSIHRLRGCDFDDTYEIDVAKEIKFTVVDLELPLGLIFQEHRIGCWVTKVLPKGSASVNGKIHVGDQLAAIDGSSAINMNVGDVAALVRDKISSVELTFMRYVGPIRPPLGRVTEEGYEVNPGNLLNRAQPSSPVRQTSSSQQRIESPSNMQTVVSPGDQQEGKSSPGEPEKRRFRLFGRRKSDK